MGSFFLGGGGSFFEKICRTQNVLRFMCKTSIHATVSVHRVWMWFSTVSQRQHCGNWNWHEMFLRTHAVWSKRANYIYVLLWANIASMGYSCMHKDEKFMQICLVPTHVIEKSHHVCLTSNFGHVARSVPLVRFLPHVRVSCLYEVLGDFQIPIGGGKMQSGASCKCQ